MVGGVGLVTCLTFAWFSAPDLALTQIAVEIVTLVLILLGLRWLPRRLEIDDLRRAHAARPRAPRSRRHVADRHGHRRRRAHLRRAHAPSARRSSRRSS